MYYSMIDNFGKMLLHPRIFYDFYLRFAYQIFMRKVNTNKRTKNYINGKKIYQKEEANELIKKLLNSDESTMICRVGINEMSMVAKSILIDIGGIDRFSEYDLYLGKIHPGIFPQDNELMKRFCKLYYDSVMKSDVNIYWNGILLEEYLLRNYKGIYMASRPLEPFAFSSPWTEALEGKKVLVIHPFAELMAEQYKHREHIFNNQKILPDYDLVTIAPVQSSGDEVPDFTDWFEALESMEKQIDSSDFDIALIGCGAYAVPLAAYIKDSGKKAVVCGGMLQLMFGIKGSRWEKTRDDIVSLYNDYWVRPDGKLIVKGSNKIEEGAYW